MERLVAIIGPTGIGKSQLALRLAVNFNGEIVSADSRQIYRYMNIGTDKPTPADVSGVPHHLIDMVEPDEEFSLATYQELAYRAINDIHERNRLPFLVGGSGLYVWAVLEGWQVPRVSPDPEFRYNLEKRAATEGTDKIYQELVSINPAVAEKIDRRNTRRVIRALEVQSKTGGALSHSGYKEPPPFKWMVIGLTAEREELYHRIDLRVDKMFEQGLVGEVENLIKMGYDLILPSMSGIGYRQLGQYFNGELTLAEAKQKIKWESHRLARHQYAWFRPKDTRINWFDINKDSFKDIEILLDEFLKN